MTHDFAVPLLAPLLRRRVGAGLIALALGAAVASISTTPAQAQVRELPDFTELVERVGPPW